ncbi:hypothetical protein [Rhizobium sp. HT1-10]|uniref:hypothetical protein n=1 Tax=Rhizobium sp. HT1-10 TaxID=3111638 RepID=UPI003C259673
MDPEPVRIRALKRAPVFADIANWMQSKIPGLADATTFRADAPVLLGHAYFLLNDSYKIRRNQISNTDDYKKAALSALSVMALRPFEPSEPDNLTSNVAYFANPIYAIASANAWLSSRNLLEHYNFAYLRRFYLSLLRIRLGCLDDFVARASNGEDYAAIKMIEMSWHDADVVEDWIHKFWLLSQRKL